MPKRFHKPRREPLSAGYGSIDKLVAKCQLELTLGKEAATAEILTHDTASGRRHTRHAANQFLKRLAPHLLVGDQFDE